MAGFGKLLFALIFIVVGGLLLFVNVGIISGEIMTEIVEYYPVLIILFGLWPIIGPLFNKKRPQPWGILFIGYGAMLMAAHSGYLEFKWFQFWRLWPLLIVYIGFEILFSGKKNKDKKKKSSYELNRDYDDDEGEDGDDFSFDDSDLWEDLKSWKDDPESWKQDAKRRAEKHQDHAQNMKELQELKSLKELKNSNELNADGVDRQYEKEDDQDETTTVMRIVQSMEKKKPNWHVKPLDEWYFVGSYELDFSQAFIPEQLTEIHLRGWIGDFDIVVPDDLAFAVEAHGRIGSISINGEDFEGWLKGVHYQTPDYEAADRKIHFQFDYKIIDLNIDRV
ncbi:cell wall-active antibiotics response protein LiaF [Tuberibacillus sp. Marseille-P3662]|uniref:cell wall-active antibiotics response protein LiaF n=1 Tax=Tuberibacillus sp. Marseille-P3662 TaxID=1965358 RepID=UPI000A1CBC5E|nr:cell wall-active antibiotics response protein LiaF [Tuberibacillus sp. Marseille-P3662]